MLICLMQPGCMNVLAIAGKVFMGDPKVPATFKAQTGIRLEKAEKTIAIVCLAPYTLSSQHDNFRSDIEEQLTRRLKLRGIEVVDHDDVANALEDLSSSFAPDAIANHVDKVDYVVQIRFDSLTHHENGSTNLLRGNADGILQVFEVRGANDAGSAEGRHVIEVLQQQMHSVYPLANPVPAETTSTMAFEKKFVDFIADDIGRHLYDVRTSEMYDHGL